MFSSSFWSRFAPKRAQVTTDFGYEFCFEAPNGSVKWYKAGKVVKGGARNTVDGRIPAPDDSKFIPLFTIYKVYTFQVVQDFFH